MVMHTHFLSRAPPMVPPLLQGSKHLQSLACPCVCLDEDKQTVLVFASRRQQISGWDHFLPFPHDFLLQSYEAVWLLSVIM